MPLRGGHAAGEPAQRARPPLFVDANAARGHFFVTDKETDIESKKKIGLICAAAEERKAEDIVVMEMRQKSSMGDFFVVMSAPSSVRVKSIVDHIEDSLEEHDVRVLHKEGLAEAHWVLMDYGDIVVHVFYHETRKFYSLETLWGDAPQKHYHPS